MANSRATLPGPTCDLLVVGAGPYGLSVAAMARAVGLNTVLVGRTMEFWRQAMPSGMFLRSGIDWHLDPMESFTLARFAETQGWDEASMTPISLERFQAYSAAFANHYGLVPEAERIESLVRNENGFLALTTCGRALRARNVAICAGFGPFPNLAHWLAQQDGVSHGVTFVDPQQYAGQELLIVGGRQSAFEWAALAAEAGASRVHVVFRHPTPRFEASDWGFVEPMIAQSETRPGWFSALPTSERDSIVRRFWEEGRLKLEPWLSSRLKEQQVSIWPEREVVARSGRRFQLSCGKTLEADRVLLATGFRIDLSKLGYLCPTTILGDLRSDEGFPILDAGFQSSVPGLYFTSFASTRSHGPFFGFVRGCPPTARLVARSVLATAQIGADFAAVEPGSA